MKIDNDGSEVQLLPNIDLMPQRVGLKFVNK